MADKDIVEHFLSQMRELLDVAHDNMGREFTGDLPDDLDEQLDKLEQDVEKFCSVSEELMQKEGISDQEIRKILKTPSQNVNPRRQRILQKARKLKGEIEQTKRGLTTAVNQVKKREDVQGKKGDKISKKVARKKKFKRVGGRKGWMPL